METFNVNVNDLKQAVKNAENSEGFKNLVTNINKRVTDGSKHNPFVSWAHAISMEGMLRVISLFGQTVVDELVKLKEND